MREIRRFRLLLMMALSLLALYGCTAQWRQFEARQLAKEGKHEESLAKLDEALAAAPTNPQIRRDVIIKRDELTRAEIETAKSKLQQGAFDEAEEAYRSALRIDENLSRAHEGLEEVQQSRRLAALNEEAQKMMQKGRTDKAMDLASRVVAEKPDDAAAREMKQKLDAEAAANLVVTRSLSALYNKPISLEFRDVPIKQAFEALARTTQINFVLDKDVKPDQRATLFLRQTNLEDAVNLLLASNRLEKKILNERSILIYPADPAKVKEYQDLVVRAFYLDHGDAKQVATTLKTLLKIKDVVPDEKLNMILIRDTPDAILLAEKVVNLHELPEAEVMLEVEVLEISRTKLMELGIQWPNQATLTPLSLAGATTTTIADLEALNNSRIQAAIGNMVINAKKSDGDANLLANPRIRVRNKVKAKILIGDKVPVITTTSTSTGFASESVQYIDVGLKLEVEPRIYSTEEVSIKIGLEVSSLVKEIRSLGGTQAYQIGTRSADTLLKLRDGETQILAGLLNDEERSSGNRIPFIGDIPLLGRLFGSQKDERAKTEIILSITPRIVQSTKRPTLEEAQFWSGSETTLRNRPLVLSSTAKQPHAKSNAAPQAKAETGKTASVHPVAQERVQEADPHKETDPHKATVAASSVELSWLPPGNVKVGDVFTVQLLINTDGAVRTLPFQLGFDPAAVEIVKIEEGGFFKAEGGGSGLSSNIDAASGKLFASVARSSAEGASGEGTAVVIHLKARQADKPVELKLLGASPISLNHQVISPKLPTSLLIPVIP